MSVFRFEEIGPELELMPLAARRAADLAGLKPSLPAWQSLPQPLREELTRLGASLQVDTSRVTTLLSQSVPPPEAVAALSETALQSPSQALLSALGDAEPLPAPAWSGLSLLERYALEKVARRGRSARLSRAYQEIVGVSATASHLDATGAARMVGVSLKTPSVRRAVARSAVRMNAAAFTRLERADAPKGDVLGTARIAGIQGAKRTADLVPLCHPLSLTRVEVVLTPDRTRLAVQIEVRVEAFDRTGVEMEALTAASVAALTVYDMLKAFDRGMQIGPTELLEKTGGREDFKHSALARFAVSETKLDEGALLALVNRAEAGATVLFAGVVRNHSAGRAVTRLEYQAYESMAAREMERIGSEIELELPGTLLAAHHRVGGLEVGDAAVLCAASAPHRDAAFTACRRLIDRIKERVPVWKREHAAGGVEWVNWEDARVDSAGNKVE